jgi:hypothetical protein
MAGIAVRLSATLPGDVNEQYPVVGQWSPYPGDNFAKDSHYEKSRDKLPWRL